MKHSPGGEKAHFSSSLSGCLSFSRTDNGIVRIHGCQEVTDDSAPLHSAQEEMLGRRRRRRRRGAAQEERLQGTIMGSFYWSG